MGTSLPSRRNVGLPSSLLPANPAGRGCFLPHHPTSICHRLLWQRLTQHPSAASTEETSRHPQSTTLPSDAQLGCGAVGALLASEPSSDLQGQVNPHRVSHS